MKIHILILAIFLVFASCTQQELRLPVADPEDVGVSSVRLNRINTAMEKYVKEKKLPGLITMVARKGKIIHFEKYGVLAEDKPMQFNTIFSIQSMTKPITSVALMMLYEEGYFQLNDPVSKYIPEFKDLKVFSHKDKEGIHVVDQLQPMTIVNLLTHTSGLGYGWGNSPVDSLYKVAKLRDGTLKDMVQKLSKIPLFYQPGTKWNYSVSTDVTSYLVEVLSGQSFDLFLQERIFKPLKMSDTYFSVPKEKIDRIASLYGPDSIGCKVILRPDTSWIARPIKFFGGGGRLFSTATDYMIFAQMMLNKGEFNGVRILGSRTVDFMTKNHLTNEEFPKGLSGYGWGLGFAVTNDVIQSHIIGSKGSYWWGGAYSTYFLIDPKEQLVLILMTQFSPNNTYPTDLEFIVSTYQAIIN